jgi:citrate lyase subunit beta/citryl-CoA lyase
MTAAKTPILPLFVPGHRAEIVPKAAASGADMVIIDLEDAVAEADKLQAHSKLTGCKATSVPIAVRVNPSGSPWFETDLKTVKVSPATMVMLPKAETTWDIDRVCKIVGAGLPVIPIVETAQGLESVALLLAHPAVPLCAFGHLDFSLDIGSSTDWESLLYVRSQLVVQSRLAGVGAPLDGVTVSFDDPTIVAEDSRRARDMGFGGKLLIHPAQVAPALSVFQPSQEDYDWAVSVLAAVADSHSAVKFDGGMIDMPVIKRAERIKQDFEAL